MPTSLDRIRRLAWLLDNSIRIPGTSLRIGLDPILGLIPGLGDAAGAILSTYIVIEAARSGVPRSTLARMVWNVLLETVIGAIPLIGDLFDAGWKANQRNVDLLERFVASPGHAVVRDRWFLIGLALVGATLATGAVVGGLLLLRWVFSL